MYTMRLFVTNPDPTPVEGAELKPAICTVPEAQPNKYCDEREAANLHSCSQNRDNPQAEEDGFGNLQSSSQNRHDLTVEEAGLKHVTCTSPKTQYTADRDEGTEILQSSPQASPQRIENSHVNWVTKIMRPLRDAPTRPRSSFITGRLFSIAEDPHSKAIKCKTVLVGDKEADVTPLLYSFTLGYTPTYIPLVFKNYTTSARVDGKSLDIELCEITGREGYDYLRPQSYGRADVVILCYSVISLTSFNSIRSKWFPEVSERCPESQYILAGTNAHLREHGDSSPEPGSHDTNFVTTVDGYQMAKDLGLAGYTECSYLTGEGLDDLFEMASRAFLRSRGGFRKAHGTTVPKRISQVLEQSPTRKNQTYLIEEAMRSYESHSTYFSAKTRLSFSSDISWESYITAHSGIGGNGDTGAKNSQSPWLQLLNTENLLQPEDKEINWSGKGQHVEFSHESEVPLVYERILGHSASAIVDSVRCRRVRLARKSIRCSRRLEKGDFLGEVKHLHRLRHPHIVQLVGTYVLGNTLAILLYPVADYTLDTFMDQCSSDSTNEDSATRLEMLLALEKFPRCLTAAMNYVHSTNTKHLDIKPTNILICARSELEVKYMVYLADFGISRNYAESADMETDGPISFTRRYCAPEVAAQELRDAKADTFSLGCVFAEIFSVLAGKTVNEFQKARESRNDSTFHNNIDKVLKWVEALDWPGFEPGKRWRYQKIVPELITKMVFENPYIRAENLVIEANLWELDNTEHPCCLEEPEKYRCVELTSS